MDDILTMFGGWTWWIIAVVLLILELLSPAIFFLWLGAAAAVVGLADLVIPMSWQYEVTLFSILSVVLLVTGRPWLMKRQKIKTDQPNLNRRMYEYVGKKYVLQQPIKNGRGKIKVEDTLWEVLGPDMEKSSWIRVTGVEGLRLRVEPVDNEAA